MTPGGSASYYCFACYRLNYAPSGPCQHCGREVAAPAEISFDAQLIWALHHPDADRATLAARTLGARRCAEAAAALEEVVLNPPDPFLGAEALRSLVAIKGVAELAPMLRDLSRDGPLLLAVVARGALAGVDRQS